MKREPSAAHVHGSVLDFRARLTYPGGFRLDAEFDVGAGPACLFGPSGGGKSTVLALIAGLLAPEEGRITLGDDVLVDTARGVRLPPEKRGIGLVFQDGQLFPHLDVRGNLRYARRGAGRDLAEVARVLELEELLDRMPSTLSGGQRQRVALGRAVLSGPRLLLLDEPVSALDAALKDRVLDYLERVLGAFGLPALFVTHDQTDARRLAREVVVLEAGRVVDAGPARETLDRLLTGGGPAPREPLVNLLRLEAVEERGGEWLGWVGPSHLVLPGPPPQGARHLRFLARDVALARTDVAGLSMRNHLPGRVTGLAGAGARVWVEVDVGQRLWAELTPGAVEELGLAEGVAVVCLLKTTALDWLR